MFSHEFEKTAILSTIARGYRRFRGSSLARSANPAKRTRGLQMLDKQRQIDTDKLSKNLYKQKTNTINRINDNAARRGLNRRVNTTDDVVSQTAYAQANKKVGGDYAKLKAKSDPAKAAANKESGGGVRGFIKKRPLVATGIAAGGTYLATRPPEYQQPQQGQFT